VQVQDCYSYIKIGLAIRLLRNVEHTDTKDYVKSTIKGLVEGLEEGNFQVTLASMASHFFLNMKDELENIENDNDEIGQALANKVKEQLTNIETVVFPESSIKKIYILPNRRFNTDYLLEQPNKLLAEGVFEKLDDIAQHDIKSACRCLLFGEATASAFHILRATESVLKYYYLHHRRQNRLKKPMWANMVDQLRAKARNKPPETLLNALDLVRTAYRNPTQHPQATYEIDSAQDLFGVCLDVIGKMGGEF
jgi:predicted ester cyclase